MSDIYFVNIEQLNDENIMDAAFFLTKERREKALRFKHKDDIKRSVCASLLINCFFYNCGTIEYNAYGKPFFRESSRFFNISHSGKWVVIGISDTEIGVDIEEIPLKPISISDAYFSDEERAFLKSLKDDDIKNSQKEFIRLWTRKEAYMKYIGRGITNELLKVNTLNDTVNDCQILSFLFDEQYYVSLCAEKNDVIFHELSIDCLFNDKFLKKSHGEMSIGGK